MVNSITFTVLNICFLKTKEDWLGWFGVFSVNLNLIGIFAGICFGCRLGKVILMSIGVSYGSIDSIFRICLISENVKLKDAGLDVLA